MRKIILWAGAALGVLLMAGQSLAATVTLYGDDVSFTFDDATLFGTGIVVGNSLFFQPTDFKAESTNTGTPETVPTNETLIITVEATTPGFDISSLQMAEAGDYALSGTGASVTAGGRLGVTSLTTTCGIFACTDSSIFNVTGFTDTGGSLQPWSGGTTVNLADTTGWGSDTQLQISFQNDLTAHTENAGEYALIQKKQGAIGLVVNPIPVPAAVWLFGSGLVGLGAVARRKRSA